MLVFGVVTIARRPALTVAIAVLTLATLVLRWGMENSPSSALRPWGQALSILLLAIFTTLVLVQVFQEGPITGYRIQGAIVVYLLMGLMWFGFRSGPAPGARAFNFAQGLRAKARRLPARLLQLRHPDDDRIRDITPLHPAARSLAMAEGLVGQLYPAILIARLVSLELQDRRTK
jgi:hypothetical protein